MIPTYIGIIQLVIGMLLLFVGSIPAMFAFVMVSDMFGGSAAFSLFSSSGSGGSSIPPVQFAMVFLLLRLMLPSARQMPMLGQAVRANALLLLFVAYGLVMAVLGPRVFAGRMDVTPMRGRVETHYVNIYAFIYSTQPLHPSSQNITTSIYLVGTLLLAIASYVVCRRPGARDTLITWAAVISVLTVIFGLISIVSPGTPIEPILKIIRNGNYAQLEQSFKGFVRITGVFPEASTYATYASIWLVFMAECWLRNLRPRLTGCCAGMLAAILIFSTSTSAYIALGLYAILLLLRFVMLPGSLRLNKMIWLTSALAVLIVLAIVAMVLSPDAAKGFQDLVLHMTVEKGSSLSGVQRKFWALQGWYAFVKSFGLGIGPGSFRSSSLLTAILGCTGLVGSIAFVGHLAKIVKIQRGSTYIPGGDPDGQVGAAASWAVLVLVLVQSFASASCDPGPEFGLLSGVALAMRMAGHARRPLGFAAPLAPFQRRMLRVG
jgi:hypothetical protein